MSDKYILYSTIRENENDPFILHVYDVSSGTEKVYNVSKEVTKPIPTDTFVYIVTKGAVQFAVEGENVDDRFIIVFEYNLENGKVRYN